MGIELSEKVGTTCKFYQYITKITIIQFIPSFLRFSVFLLTFPLKTDILTHFGPKKGDLVALELSGKVGTTACKFYQYATKIIIILFIPSLPCFSGVSVDFSPKNRHFDPFWAQK